MLTKDDVERARSLAARVEQWAKLCVVFITGASVEPDETEAAAVLREYGLMVQIFMGLAVLPPTLTLMAEEHKYDHDVVFTGIMDEAVKDFRTIDQTTLVLKLKAASERIGKWMAGRVEVES